MYCCRENLISHSFDSARPLFRACHCCRTAVRNAFSWELAHIRLLSYVLLSSLFGINLLKYPPLSHPSDGLLSMAQSSFFFPNNDPLLAQLLPSPVAILTSLSTNATSGKSSETLLFCLSASFACFPFFFPFPF